MSYAAIQASWLEDEQGQRYPLNGTLSLGRSKTSNRYGFAHDKVSRRHVLIHAQDNGEFWIVDLGSTNGTYLNAARLLAPSRLRDGDAVNLGNGVQLRFRQPGASESVRSFSTLASTAHDVRVERRWIFVADLEGFTRLSKTLPAAEFAMKVGEWLAATSEVLGKFGGQVNRYTGDGFLAFWRECPEAARWVASALREFNRLRPGRLPFRLALHWGEVAIGGAPSFGEESLMSDDLSLTFRLEKLAASLSIPFLASAAAAERLAPEIALTPVPGSHEVKGYPPLTGLHTLREG